MPDRPLILFPSPERADREHKTPVFTKTVRPSFGRQFTRLQPSFNLLKNAFEQKALKLQQSPTGINPEFALVFEIIGTVDNFYTAVKNTDGLEWIFDSEVEPFDPDDDFYQVDKDSGERVDDSLNGKLYCVMSNQQAMAQLLSLWQRHQNGESDVFKRGFAGLRDIFTHIKDIRKWDARDRITETHALDYWRESLEFDGDSPVPFEIELWFNIDDSGKGLVPDRQNTEWQAVRKGSLQHEIFIGENPIVWNDDDLIIKVNCKEEANKIKTAIPYCLFVSFEVAEGFDVNLYADVSAKIHQRVQISNN